MSLFKINKLTLVRHRISNTNLNCFLSLKSFYPLRIFVKIVRYPVGIWIEQKGFSSQTSLAKKFSKNSQRLTGYQKKATTRGFLYFQSGCASLSMTVLQPITGGFYGGCKKEHLQGNLALEETFQ
jgi:hypothetical protein